jgi:dipeptidyl aminopeptidase/acylaminoacyl peptidase
VLNDAYVLDIATQKMTRHTEHEAGGLRAENFAIPDRIQFASGTGKALYNVQAYVYRPLKLPESKKAPVVVLIHGGPEAQTRPGFDGFVQFLVSELGVAVVAPNIRGSTGYGRLFTSMDDGVQRKDALNDLDTLLDEIAKDPNLDSKRVALMGGSYGGFMTLWGLTEFSDRLRAGVDIVGISDLGTFLTNTANYRRDLRRAEYGDERDPKIKAFFDATSPLKNASKIKVPLFVIQGANDPRVPASEAAQIAAAARNNGVQVWEMTALDEGHGFRKKQNVNRMRLSIAQFLQATLLSP